MSLKLAMDVPYVNVRALTIRPDAELPEIEFAAGPYEGPEPLWFCFRLVETTPDAPHAAKIRLTLKHFDDPRGVAAATDLLPVYRPADQGWHRASAGVGTLTPDGQMRISWQIPAPAPVLDVAFCFPYGRAELAALVNKSKGYWKSEEIGLSQAGRPFLRLANDAGAPGGPRQGLYLVARQNPAETPASWVLDGILQSFSRQKKDPYLAWSVPLVDIDGATKGRGGVAAAPQGMVRAWSTPPLAHECHVIQHDLARWKARCRPVLAVDFRAAAALDTDGLACVLPAADRTPELAATAEKWANLMQQDLGAEYAAKDFKRPAPPRAPWQTPTFTDYVCETLGVCALTLAVPYGKIGSTVLSQRHYREAGERIAKAWLRRAGV